MKTLFSMLTLLAGLCFAAVSQAATFAPHACQAIDYQFVVTYSSTGMKNLNSTDTFLVCPVPRTKDYTNAAASAVVYFVDDGKDKSCFFDNYDIDSGANFVIYSSASGKSRLALPTLTSTVQWSPFILECHLYSGSAITGYYLLE